MSKAAISVGLAVAVIVSILLLAIAAGSGRNSEAPQGDRGTTVTEVRLSDGTRCAVMDKPQGAAISCDWGTR